MIDPHPVETLETRIAPAALIGLENLSETFPATELGIEGVAVALSPEISADGKSATFIDVDGDAFTVTTTKGKFSADNFTYVGDELTGQGYLQKIDLGFQSFGWAFYGTKLTVA